MDLRPSLILAKIQEMAIGVFIIAFVSSKDRYYLVPYIKPGR